MEIKNYFTYNSLDNEIESISTKRTLTIVHNILRELRSASKLNETYSLITEKVCIDIGYDRSFFLMENNNLLKLTGIYYKNDLNLANKHLTSLQQHSLKLDIKTPELEAFKTSKPKLYTASSSYVTNFFKEFSIIKQPDSYIIVPIKGREKVFGLIIADYFDSKKEVSDNDIIKMSWFATATAFIIDKIMTIELLNQELQERTYALKKANSEITNMYKKAIESDRLKSEFLANISHELRTPLNSIIGFSKVILKGIDGEINEVQRTDLTAIYNSGVHLLGIINDILDFSKIEAGRMELVLEEVDMGELIKSAVATSQGLIKDKGISLNLEIEENLPPITVDKTRIRQVLLNLLSNAIKFTEKGEVTVKAALGGDEIVIVVCDTGAGIAEKDIPYIFDAFRQIDGSSTRRIGGTGLGLSISKKFVELHGGRIWVKSKLGEGSTFHFTIPVNKPPLTT